MNAFLPNLLFAFISLAMCPLAHAAAPDRISVKENRFVNSSGQTIIFRGVNTSDPAKLARNGRWTADYFKQAKAWGANIVRFPVHPSSWRTTGEHEYIRLLDQGVQWATELGLHVIIDWHSIGDLLTGRFQESNGKGIYQTTKRETAEFWRTMAKQYGANPTVAFFELFNEPTTFDNPVTPETWLQWKEFMEELIGIIRANGGLAVPLVAEFNWAYDLRPVAGDPVNADGIGYVSHPYPMKRKQPWEPKWSADWGFVAAKHPVFLTEIGFSDSSEPGAHDPCIGNESYGDAITAFAAKLGVSYTVWVFDPDWPPSLLTDWNYNPSRQGAYFRKAFQTRAP
jgi:hypothetical protein